MQNVQCLWLNVKKKLAGNFKDATINYILIMLFIYLFQFLFGAENSVVALIFAPLILVLMTRDLTAQPVKNLCRQMLLLGAMAVFASLTSVVSASVALLINFFMLFGILYVYTCEWGEHLYFQYVLSYLFFIFISAIPPAHLPKRLAAIAVGAVCLILYQWVRGRGRMEKIVEEVLVSLLDEAEACTISLSKGGAHLPDHRKIRTDLDRLSRSVHHRRRKTLCISDADFALLEAGRSLQELIQMLGELSNTVDPAAYSLIRRIGEQITQFRGYVMQEKTEIPYLSEADFCGVRSKEMESLYQVLSYIRERLLELRQQEKYRNFQKTSLPLSVRLKTVVNLSPVRAIYAARIACTLAVCIMLVQHFQLAHGKWLLFTIASVSLPYADDVGEKAKKRMLATIIGGMIGVVAFSLIPSPIGRTVLTMSAGYLSFYMPDYIRNFSCATIGAVLMDTGLGPVGGMALIRLGYIILGILISYAVNCLVLPFDRKKATHQLGQKYISVTKALADSFQRPYFDIQMYHHLLMYQHMLAHKIYQNAVVLHWDGVDDFLERYRR